MDFKKIDILGCLTYEMSQAKTRLLSLILFLIFKKIRIGGLIIE